MDAMTNQPFEFSAAQAAEAIADGLCSSEELVRSCLQRVTELEPRVQAWHYLDAEHALRQAREADLQRRGGQPLGPLHGVPVGVKDIFDTHDMPTEDGTPLHAGRTPAQDATAVALLRQAGAVIMGKTVTTELGVYGPGKTRNPLESQRTPGGSSSGSAAAVASGMVPLAIGSQTNGSTLRPASYCGVCGYKPTHGLISRHRMLRQSRALDHVGLFARTVEDLALLGEVLMQFDVQDPDMHPLAPPRLRQVAAEEPPVPPTLALVRTPAWAQADDDLREGFAELESFLGARVEVVDLDELLDPVYQWHRTVMEADLALSFRREYGRAADRLSPSLRQIIERGSETLAMDYNQALQLLPGLNDSLAQLLTEYDAILTPATTGQAPLGLESTGSPVFCTPWTAAGMPAVSLPLLQGANGLPIGVQLVGARREDARLLRTAAWLAREVRSS